jgi:hypothetical protein
MCHAEYFTNKILSEEVVFSRDENGTRHSTQ